MEKPSISVFYLGWPKTAALKLHPSVKNLLESFGSGALLPKVTNGKPIWQCKFNTLLRGADVYFTGEERLPLFGLFRERPCRITNGCQPFQSIWWRNERIIFSASRRNLSAPRQVRLNEEIRRRRLFASYLLKGRRVAAPTDTEKWRCDRMRFCSMQVLTPPPALLNHPATRGDLDPHRAERHPKRDKGTSDRNTSAGLYQPTGNLLTSRSNFFVRCLLRPIFG